MPMKRLLAIMVVLVITTSSSLAAQGVWRCVTGGRCDLMSGQGVSCPMRAPSSTDRVKSAAHCSHCGAGKRRGAVSISGSCQCVFVPHATAGPAAVSQAHSLFIAEFASNFVLLPPAPAMATGFPVPSIVFPTGPPEGSILACPVSSLASRAPPRYLAS